MKPEKEASPQKLVIQEKPSGIIRLRKWPILLVVAMVSAMAAVLIYGVNFAHVDTEEEAATKKVDIQEVKPLLIGEGSGLNIEPPREAVAIPESPRGERQEPLIVVARQEPAGNPELDNLRRIKSQALLSALSSPLKVKTAAAVDQGVTPIQARESEKEKEAAAGTPYPLYEGQYDPAADKDKEAFFARSRQRDDEWILPNARMAGQRYELKTGTVIPSAMITGINSDLPGNIIAQVTQNVYDSATGKHLLVPQGAKLYGIYDSRVIFGQSRVLVAWNRVIFPDGSSITLDAMPGSDMSGYAGFADDVDNHYFRIFGSMALMSLFMGSSAYAMDMTNNSGNGDKSSMSDEFISSLTANFGQATTTVLQKNLNIKPTIGIRPGYQFNVVLTKDVVFQAPFKSGRRGQ